MSGDAEAVEQEFTVAGELGLHARPAARFVTLATRFDSEISVARGSEWVSGSSVLSILSLAASQGTVLRLRAVGRDSQDAVQALGALLESDDDSAEGSKPTV